MFSYSSDSWKMTIYIYEKHALSNSLFYYNLML